MKESIPENRPHPVLVNGILAFFAVNFLNGFLVILKETIPAIKGGMANLMFHHWIAQGVILGISMLLLTAVFYKIGLGEKLRAGDPCCVRYSILGTVIGAGLILGFYVLHGFGIL